ncbi:MAG: hypothetical protein M1828_004799 [Chrysothrix sp. TS-e1954]|nr:MAG: hypothetical protein M1828_004799 [Chrysothrix sp. TS-e1954]
MASIFTYDPDPPRVASPWDRHILPSSRESTGRQGRSRPRSSDASGIDLDQTLLDVIDRPNVTRLDAEPQEGPTEYKLHLLLRPRRSFSSTTTGSHIAGSQHARLPFTGAQDQFETNSANANLHSQSSVSRQHRLEQLTTQLLWRLQQSSPFHTSSTVDLILPSLPEATLELQPPQTLSKLVPGLEESKGALYEIGVADDGSLIGLTKDELDESLGNLRAMAASLGCSVDTLRMLDVGECEWTEEIHPGQNLRHGSRSERLYVAEAYVKPELPYSGKEHHESALNKEASTQVHGEAETITVEGEAPTQDQIRVTLTGATTSGKSSLLGTLSTSTLDNGRGKSRLSLLKHRHEIATGMTSSVAQELIGFKEHASVLEDSHTDVINYATANVTTWNDIHAGSRDGRLAFLSDSAGHPRYRRTTVRGLVGWAPHWTMLCISATDIASSRVPALQRGSDTDAADFTGANAHLSMAHLDLCLRLELPLAIVITKLDLADKQTFRQILSSVLSSVKAAGRQPTIISSAGGGRSEEQLQTIATDDSREIKRIVATIRQNDVKIVPILFTSAVNGTGISKLHALLRHLPIFRPCPVPNFLLKSQTEHKEPLAIFHIDDTYELTRAKAAGNVFLGVNQARGVIMSGHLAGGSITVGNELLLGPFPATNDIAKRSSRDDGTPPLSQNEEAFLAPRSFTDALAKVTTAVSRGSGVVSGDEWKRVKVISVRNLRLPVRCLESDRVGTIAVSFIDDSQVPTPVMIRRGMVLVDKSATSTHTFTAKFRIQDASSAVVGTRVVMYTASVRAAAKVIAIALHDENGNDNAGPGDSSDDFAFELDDRDKGSLQSLDNPSERHESILVTFQLSTCKEWIEVGAKILVMPGGGPGLHSGTERGVKGVAGLEGYVGRIVETFG